MYQNVIAMASHKYCIPSESGHKEIGVYKFHVVNFYDFSD
jgi:hypothetical protein